MSLQFWLRNSQGLDGELCPALESKEVNCYQSRGTMLIHYGNNHKRSLMRSQTKHPKIQFGKNVSGLNYPIITN